MLTQIHYDPPRSHTKTQTKWVIEEGSKVLSQSIKILELKINPVLAEGASCYFSALVGAYGCLSKVQIGLNSRIVDVWTAQEILPYLISMSADNEKNFGINSILYGTGNNLEIELDNDQNALLSFNRPTVDSVTVSLKLSVYSDLLNNIGVITDRLEIIVDWEQNTKKWLLPTSGSVTSINILPPYLSYETLNQDVSQPSEVSFRQWERDQWGIPQNTTGGSQKTEVRSNGFNNKVVGRMLLATTPIQISQTTPQAEMVDLYNLFGYYMSTPMYNENYNLSKNGRSLLTFRGVSNDSLKHALCVDTWGEACFVTNGHINSSKSVVRQLNPATPVTNMVNGFCSYGCVEVNDRITKDLVFTYYRTNPKPTGDNPTRSEEHHV